MASDPYAQVQELWQRYLGTHDRADLDEAIAAAERVAAEEEGDAPLLCELHATLTSMLMNRWHLDHRDTDLDRAAVTAEAAAATAEPAGFDAGRHWHRAGLVHLERHHRGYLADDARLAVAAFDQALRRSPSEAGYLASQAEALRLLYEAERDPALIDRVVKLLRERADADPVRLQSDLGTALQDRWSLSRESRDLDEAIAAHEAALAASGEKRPAWIVANLANALRQRHTVSRQRADLYRALDLYEEVVGRAPDGLDGMNARELNHYALAWRQRFLHEDERGHLDRAIDLHRRALAKAEPPDRVIYLRNLADDLSQHLWGDSLGHLAEAIELLRTARTLASDDLHVARDLTALLRHRYLITGTEADKAELLALVDDVVAGLGGQHAAAEGFLGVRAQLSRPRLSVERLADGAVWVLRGEYGGRDHTLVVVPSEGFALAAADEDPYAKFFADIMPVAAEVGEPLLVLAGRQTTLREFPEGEGLEGEELAAAALASAETAVPSTRIGGVWIEGPFKRRKSPLAYVVRALIDGKVWTFVQVTNEKMSEPLRERIGPYLLELTELAERSYETAALISTWIAAEGLPLLPYHQQPGWTAKQLAKDALTALTAPLKVSGPYRLQGLDYRAHLLTGYFSGGKRRMCYVEPDPGVVDFDEHTRSLFLSVLGEVPVTQPDWPADLIWSDLPQGNGAWLTVPIPPISRDPRKNAEAVLYLFGSESLEVASIEVPGWATRGGNLGKLIKKYGLRTHMVRPAPGAPPTFLMTELEDVSESHGSEIESDLYLSEAVTAIEQGRLLAAFRSFVYHRYLGDSADPEVVSGGVAVGTHLAGLLLDEGRLDFAEWVAAWTAVQAERTGAHDQARAARRLAAMACEYMGWLDEAVMHLTAAVANPAPFSDIWLEGQLNMSAGLTIATTFSDHEPERRYLDPMPEKSRALLTRAAVHLERAAEIYANLEGERALRSRRTVELYRWRVADLLGDGDAALERLAELRVAPGIAEDEALRQTGDWFTIAALRRQAYADPSLLGQFDKSAYAHLRRVQGFKQVNMAKLVPVLAMVGDDRQARGDYEGAMRLFRTARAAQRAGYAALVRPPRPEETHGGWMAIEVIGRLARCAAVHPRMLDEHPMEIVLEAENAKNRWFLRDLTMGLPHRPPVERAGDETPGLPVEALADPRVDLAERSWRGEQGGVVSATLDEPAARALWERLPGGTAVLSFYATKSETFLHVVRDPAQPPVTLRLPVSAAELERAGTRMQAYFSAAGLFGAIDPSDPGRHHRRFLKPLDELGELLAPAVPYLEDSELVVAVPHRQWHNLPVHALLLPRLWRRGSTPGWTYVPSLGMLDFLMTRARDRQLARFVRAGVTTAPMPGDDVVAMTAAHEKLCEILRTAFPAVRASFGEQATVASFQEASRSVVLHHLLAHGAFRDKADIMHSGFALASGLLTGRDLIGEGTRAAHVTVQACSLGRNVTGGSDEMWGPTRAFLAAGADSVLAPLWDVDLGSSTELLAHFYRRWLWDGVPKWRAIADAQRAMWRDDDQPAWQHVYHWSAFKLIGS
ncbi:CHAT domain-containing protein, partial [Nonomuraea sp. RK-328]|nr:CHAT domain-containing protein [Nonomuraea sp. RK-328]